MTVIETADWHGSASGPHFARETPDEWWKHRSKQFGRDVLFYRIVREARP